LGHLWQRWLPDAQPEIAEFLAELCNQLTQGNIQSGEPLIAILDQALATSGQAYPCQVTLATLSDRGPTRQRNEDACYPPSGTVTTHQFEQKQPLVIVCDGIGGHEGGDVASNLAIATLQQQLQPDLESSPLPAIALISQLEQATFAANDAISQQNDHEQRQERQRMGTTLVMATISHHELYLTHVGDSRAYRLSKTGCQQVTLDDDLASREVRLGYAIYREALQHPGSGSLVQALGMSASDLLHPTVQRFMLDEDCLFLLCSDGLSDNNRVEQYWQTELLPVLQGKIDLATAAARLVEVANRQNGHDNVTVGLVHCQVGAVTQPIALERSLALPSPTSTHLLSPTRAADTQLSVIQPRRWSLLPLLVSVLALVGLAGVFTYLLIPREARFWLNPQASPQPAVELPPPTQSPAPSPSTSINSQALLQIPTKADGTTVLLNLPLVTATKSENVRSVRVPPGSILKVVRQISSNRGMVYTLKLCWVPQESQVRPGLGKPGESVEADKQAIEQMTTMTSERLLSEQQQSIEQHCVPPPKSSPSPTSSASLPL
jgi:serine/threonine protein phosphatase PrpC